VTAVADKVEEPRLTMTINLTEGRPTMQLTDQWEENHQPFARTAGRTIADLHPKEGASLREIHKRKEEEEGKLTKERRKQRGR